MQDRVFLFVDEFFKERAKKEAGQKNTLKIELIDWRFPDRRSFYDVYNATIELWLYLLAYKKA